MLVYDAKVSGAVRAPAGVNCYMLYKDLYKDFAEGVSLTTTLSTPPECKHGNGWYVTFRIWIFKKRAFVCSDCGNVRYR